MVYVEITRDNIEREHICCALGSDKANQARAATKKAWLKARFDDGLVFRRLDQRGKCFVEYLPLENGWKPVLGDNLLLINCLWVSGQFKGHGHGAALLQSVIDDAVKKKRAGLAVVTSSRLKPFLTDRKFFLAHGFELADTAQPYFELLWRPLIKAATRPRFTDAARAGTIVTKADLTFVYSHQCPFMEEYVGQLEAAAGEAGFTTQMRRLETATDAQVFASPFGTLGIYHKGRLVTHELVPPAKIFAFLAGLKS